MGNERVDFSRLARDRIEAAQAAIAAAEKSAMHAYAAGSFHDSDTPVAPWVASPGGQFHSTFAERLRKHEAHLNTIKNALPFRSADSRVYNTSAPADSHRPGNKDVIHHLQLPPWSQPAQLPSFSTYQKPDSIASKVSLEGSSRVSTAGSGATIGWAGPWVVTHRAGGADRMYPAHMRSSKPTKRLQARQSGDDSASAVLEPQLERSVVRQDNSLSQAIPDVRWQLPPQNPALRTHKLTAEHAVMPSEGPPMRNVAAAPLTHSPTRQSRIPSPTKSTSKVFATGPTGSVHSFPLDKQVPDALQPRHTDNVQSTSLMQPAAALCPSEGLGSLRENIRDQLERSQGELKSRNLTMRSDRQHAGKEQRIPQRLQKPGKPAWVDTDVGKSQIQTGTSGFGRPTVRQTGDSAVLRQRNQQQQQKNASASCKSEASDTQGTKTAATQEKTSRLQAAPSPSPSSQRNSTTQQRVQDVGISTSHRHGSQGLLDKRESVNANDNPRRTTVRGTMPSQEPSNQHHCPEVLESDHDQSTGRSPTPIERLRRLQRTRTYTQPRVESMESSPNSIPHVHTASSSNEPPTFAQGSSQQPSSVEKIHEMKNGTATKGRHSMHKIRDGTKSDHCPGDSEHRAHAVRKLQVGNSLVDGAASGTSNHEFSASKGAAREYQPSMSSTVSTAQKRGTVHPKKPAQTRVGQSDAHAVEDTPVGPGRTGAGIDFDKLIDLKLQEHGETPAAAVSTKLHKCGTCNRQFTAEALAKHRAVCAKVFASKRLPMDMTQQRLSGIAETAQHRARSGTSSYVDKTRKRAAAGRPGALGSRSTAVMDERPAAAEILSRAGKWKQQSQQLRAAMSSNRRIQAAEKRGEDITSLQLEDNSVPDDRVPCPHCHRKFAPLTAERHIPKCKDIRAKPSFLKKGSGNAGGNLARLKPSR